MPVISYEKKVHGKRIWVMSKVTQEIDIREDGGDCVTTAKDESGEIYFQLRVPTDGDPEEFDVTSNLYSRLGDDFLQSETNFKATFNVNKYMQLLVKKNARPDREYLTIGNSPSARVLRQLGLERHPFQFRFARGMNSCFDLPNPDYRPPFKFK